MLTPYAKAHIRLLQIDVRFQRVIARNPRYYDKYDRKYSTGRVAFAYTNGQSALACLRSDTVLFNMLVHNQHPTKSESLP